jgi:hypothetical protein
MRKLLRKWSLVNRVAGMVKLTRILVVRAEMDGTIKGSSPVAGFESGGSTTTQFAKYEKLFYSMLLGR